MGESLFDLVDQGKEAAQRIEDCLNNVNERLYTKENLFNRAVDIYQQMDTLKSDLKALREDFTYDEDVNPEGLPKEDVKEVVAFANKYVSDGLDKVIETAELYKQLKEELIGID